MHCWEEYSTGLTNIFCNTLDLNTSIVGPTFQVSTGINDASNPDVIHVNNQHYLVVWKERSFSPFINS